MATVGHIAAFAVQVVESVLVDAVGAGAVIEKEFAVAAVLVVQTADKVVSFCVAADSLDDFLLTDVVDVVAFVDAVVFVAFSAAAAAAVDVVIAV